MRRMLILVAALALAALSVAAVASADRGHRGDRNHDGLPDRWERRHHLSLKVNQAHRDPDRDKLDNRNEFRHGTDPNKRDTDDDGVRDRDEVNPAGTIASFDNGVLTITLRNGQSVSGRVTADTKIECENEDEINAMAARDGGDDNSGPGSTSSGREEENEVEVENENELEHSGTTTTTTPSSNSGPGSANSGPGDENEDKARACGADALKHGVTVKEADAKLTSNGLVFEEIELA
ncbi:MAG: hypothetical protein ACJ76R_10390 [Solirubrobacteraceae bacterium]